MFAFSRRKKKIQTFNLFKRTKYVLFLTMKLCRKKQKKERNGKNNVRFLYLTIQIMHSMLRQQEWTNSNGMMKPFRVSIHKKKQNTNIFLKIIEYVEIKNYKKTYAMFFSFRKVIVINSKHDGS